MKYYVFYVESCSPKVKKFNSKLDAEFFAAYYAVHNKDTSEDNWIDFIVKGKIKPIDVQWQKAIKELNK